MPGIAAQLARAPAPASSPSPLRMQAHPRPPPHARPAPPLQADGSSSQQALRAELQGQLQWLVQNYGARRSALLEEILPEVGAGCSVPPSHATPPPIPSCGALIGHFLNTEC